MTTDRRRKVVPLIFAGLLVWIIALTCTSRALADNGTWVSATSGGLWSDSGKWQGGVIANGQDGVADFSTLDLTADDTVHLDSSRTIGSLLFGDTTPSNNWILDNNGASTNVLTLAVSSGNPLIQVNNQTATISVILAGTQGFAESGSGTLILTGANTFTGVTSLSAGTLRVGAASALQNSTVSVNVDGGLTFGGSVGTFTFGGLSGSHNFALADAGNSAVTLQVGSNKANTSFSGNIGGSGALTKIGTGALTLSGTNNYAGLTIVQKGSLIFSSNLAIPNAGTPSIIVQSGATVALGSPIDQTFLNSVTSSSAGIVALAADSPSANLDFSSAGANLPNVSLGAFGGSWTYGGTLTPNGSVYRLGGGGGTLTVNSQLSGPNSITMPSSAGTVVLSNPSNSFAGGVTINSGATLSFSTDGVSTGSNTPLGAIPNVPATNIVINNGTLQSTGASVTLNANRAVALGTSLVTPLFSVDSIDVAAGSQFTIPGAITGVGTLQKTGSGTLILSGANTYSGGTTVNGGTLTVANGGTLGSYLAGFPALTVNGPNNINSVVNLAGDTVITALSGNISGTGTATVNIPANSTLTISQNYVASSGYYGGISGAGGLLVSGGGSLQYLGGTNAYTGPTTVAGGQLQVIGGHPLASTTLTLAGGELYDVNTQSFSSTTLEQGGSSVLAGGSLGSITRATNLGGTVAGSALDIGTTVAGLTTNTANTAGSILGGWATAGFNWAVSAANGTSPGAISYVFQYTANTWGPNNNTQVTANNSPPPGSTTNSLAFNTTGTIGAYTVTLNGDNTIISGGILVNTHGTNNSSTITGGTLTSGNGTDLIVHQQNVVTVVAPLIINSVITGSIGLTKTGNGQVILGGVNTYTGSTYIGQGTVTINSESPTGGSLGMPPTAGTASYSVGSIIVNGDASENNGGGTLQAAANVVLNPNRTLYLGSVVGYGVGNIDVTAGNTLTIGGIISNNAAPTTTGVGTLVKLDSGTLNIAGTNNSYAGGTIVYGGVLIAGPDTTSTTPGAAAPLGALPAPGFGTNNITLGGGTLEADSTYTINPLRGIGLGWRIGFPGNSAGTIDVTAGNTLTYNGIIIDNKMPALSAGALVKTDGGTLVLGGNNTYTGGTTVAGGTLRTTATGTIGTNSGPLFGPLVVSAAPGGTSVLILGNNQTVGQLSGTVATGGSATVAVAEGVDFTVYQFVQTTFAGTLANSGTFTMASAGAGRLELTGAPILNDNSALAVSGGTLRFNVGSGASTIGTGVVATISSAATLELAGTVSALSASANRVAIVNNSSATAGLLVSGLHQVVGGIDGSGNTQVNAGSDLSANHIVQTALIIGGTSGIPALVTIDPSDASGNPLANSIAQDGPFPIEGSNADLVGGVARDDSASLPSSPPAPNELNGHANVPEPTSLFLLVIGGLRFLGVLNRRAGTSERGRPSDCDRRFLIPACG